MDLNMKVKCKEEKVKMKNACDMVKVKEEEGRY
jgi:hypothetical protein